MGMMNYSQIKRSAGRRRPFRFARVRVPSRMGWRRRALSNLRIGGLLGIEHKTFDTSANYLTMPASANWTGCEVNPPAVESCLCAIAQGDAYDERDGNRVIVDSIEISGIVHYTEQLSAAEMESEIAFLALVLDIQTNGAELSSEDVYSNTLNLGGTSCNPVRNPSYSGLLS